jgi:hypothetical protein
MRAGGIVLAFAAGLFAFATAAAQEPSRPTLRLEAGGMAWHLDESSCYDVVALERLDRPGELLPLDGHLEAKGGKGWRVEAGPLSRSDDSRSPCRLRRERSSEGERLSSILEWPDLRIEKSLAFDAHDGSLEISFRLEGNGVAGIELAYLPIARVGGSPGEGELEFRRRGLVETKGRFEAVWRSVRLRAESSKGASTFDEELGGALLDRGRALGIAALPGRGEQLPVRVGWDRGRPFLGLAYRRFSPSGRPGSSLEGTLRLVPLLGGGGKNPFDRKLSGLPAGDDDPRLPLPATPLRPAFRTGRLLAGWSPATADVFPDSPIPAGPPLPAELVAARGESEGFLLALGVSGRPLAGVELRPGALRGAAGEIPAQQLSWNPLGSFVSTAPGHPFGWGGELVDSLGEPRSFDLPPGRNRIVLVGVRVPRSASAGLYEGEVEILAGGKRLTTFPVRLRVLAFELPDRRSFPVWAPVWRNRLVEREGKKRGASLFPQYLDLLAEHRMSQLYLDAPPVVQFGEAGEVSSSDFVRFDRAFDALDRRFRSSGYAVADLFLGHAGGLRDVLLGESVTAAPERLLRRLGSFGAALGGHLRATGRIERLTIPLYDEPTEEEVPLLCEAAEALRRGDPGLEVTYWGLPREELVGRFPVWTVPAQLYSRSWGGEARRRGEKVRLYNPDGFCVDDTGVRLRSLFWWLWAEGIDGLFQWTSNGWGESAEGGSAWDANRTASWLLPGADGPISTLRLERARDGIEDLETLRLLESLVVEPARDVDPVDLERARGLLDRARTVSWSPEEEKLPRLAIRDPLELERIRREVAETVERLWLAAEEVDRLRTERGGARVSRGDVGRSPTARGAGAAFRHRHRPFRR